MAEFNTETRTPSKKYFTGYIELADGTRLMAHSSTTDSVGAEQAANITD